MCASLCQHLRLCVSVCMCVRFWGVGFRVYHLQCSINLVSMHLQGNWTSFKVGLALSLSPLSITETQTQSFGRPSAERGWLKHIKGSFTTQTGEDYTCSKCFILFQVQESPWFQCQFLSVNICLSCSKSVYLSMTFPKNVLNTCTFFTLPSLNVIPIPQFSTKGKLSGIAELFGLSFLLDFNPKTCSHLTLFTVSL